MIMKKSLLAIAISLIASGSVSAIAAAPASGTQIGTGTLAVTGTVADSACTVSFPTSVTLPSFSKADFSAKTQNSTIGSQNAGNITFSGCNGQSVNIKLTTTSTVSGNGLLTYPVVNGKEQGQFAITVGLDKDGTMRFMKANKDDTNFQNISVNNESYSIPVTVGTYKTGNNVNDVSYGTYNVNYVFTATYA